MDLRGNVSHPDTGEKIIGETVPDWKNLIDQLRNAALAIPGFRIQHWDVGLTSRGPVVFEFNTAGGPCVVELAQGRGLYDADLIAFMARLAESEKRSRFIGTPVTMSGN